MLAGSWASTVTDQASRIGSGWGTRCSEPRRQPCPSNWWAAAASGLRETCLVTDRTTRWRREGPQTWKLVGVSIGLLCGVVGMSFWFVGIWLPNRFGSGATRFVNDSGVALELYEGTSEGVNGRPGLVLAPGEEGEWSCSDFYAVVILRPDGSVISAPGSWCRDQEVQISPCWADSDTTGRAWNCRPSGL